MNAGSHSLLNQGLGFSGLGKSSELQSKILFVLLTVIIYRLGTYIPLPGINVMVLGEINSTQAGGVLGMFNLFTGGALGRMSIFALNIMPYITASIIMQLMSVVSTEISNLKKEGERGRKKINQYTRYLTIFLALSQGYGFSVGLEHMPTSSGSLVLEPGYFFRIVSMISLTGGTILVMWMAEQINTRGIGNGSSIIIFTGIVSSFPSAGAAIFDLGRTGALSSVTIFATFAIIIALIYSIVFVEKAQRRITVQYPRRQVGRMMTREDKTHIPLKINTSGVIPAIFASSLLLFPVTIAGFSQNLEVDGWRQFVSLHLSHGKPLYLALYTFLIVFFCFFYTSIIFNPDETADNLKKNGGIVLGRRPGAHTSAYFDYVLTRLTVVASVYMVIVCVTPDILTSQYSVPLQLGGTSLLIVVNVVIDLIAQIQTHLLSTQYENLMKKARIKGGVMR